MEVQAVLQVVLHVPAVQAPATVRLERAVVTGTPTSSGVGGRCDRQEQYSCEQKYPERSSNPLKKIA